MTTEKEPACGEAPERAGDVGGPAVDRVGGATGVGVPHLRSGLWHGHLGQL